MNNVQEVLEAVGKEINELYLAIAICFVTALLAFGFSVILFMLQQNTKVQLTDIQAKLAILQETVEKGSQK